MRKQVVKSVWYENRKWCLPCPWRFEPHQWQIFPPNRFYKMLLYLPWPVNASDPNWIILENKINYCCNLTKKFIQIISFLIKKNTHLEGSHASVTWTKFGIALVQNKINLENPFWESLDVANHRLHLLSRNQCYPETK